MGLALSNTLARIHSTAVLATAAMLLLPLQANCASCSTGSNDCPHCAAIASQDTAQPGRSCCQVPKTPSDDSAKTVHGNSPRCQCDVGAPERTLPAQEKAFSPSDFAATTVAFTAPAPPAVTSQLAASFTLADLPPPIPHRILHCTWII